MRNTGSFESCFFLQSYVLVLFQNLSFFFLPLSISAHVFAVLTYLGNIPLNTREFTSWIQNFVFFSQKGIIYHSYSYLIYYDQTENYTFVNDCNCFYESLPKGTSSDQMSDPALKTSKHCIFFSFFSFWLFHLFAFQMLFPFPGFPSETLLSPPTPPAPQPICLRETSHVLLIFRQYRQSIAVW